MEVARDEDVGEEGFAKGGVVGDDGVFSDDVCFSHFLDAVVDGGCGDAGFSADLAGGVVGVLFKDGEDVAVFFVRVFVHGGTFVPSIDINVVVLVYFTIFF